MEWCKKLETNFYAITKKERTFRPLPTVPKFEEVESCPSFCLALCCHEPHRIACRLRSHARARLQCKPSGAS